MGDKETNAGNLKKSSRRRLGLDFVNTVSWRGRQKSEELLNTYRDLVKWCRQANILIEREAKALSRQAGKHPSEAAKTLKHAIELREVIYSIFYSSAEDHAPQKKDLLTFNKYLSRVMMHSQISKTEDGFSWETEGDKKRLDWILNPIVRSAADLLVSDEINRVKDCGDKTCGWLFVDSSRNQSRRWCDMKDCGNRAKAKRFYERKKISKHL
jgi:predicted RNA-binding Zn ribbon-like protein